MCNFNKVSYIWVFLFIGSLYGEGVEWGSVEAAALHLITVGGFFSVTQPHISYSDVESSFGTGYSV